MPDYSIETKYNNVLVFTIKRKQVHNAVNFHVMQGLEEAIKMIHKDKSLSLFVITGEGDKAFCSGGDLQAFHSLQTANQSLEMLERMTHILFSIATLPVPVIAVLNGTAVGGGMELATACDIRYANRTARFGFIQANLSITTGWGGGTLLLEKFQPSLALEWLLKAQKWDSLKWEKLGFVSALFSEEPLAFFEKEFDSVLKQEVEVIRAYKQIYLEKLDHSSLLNRMLKEAKSCSVLWESEAHHLAVSNFLNNGK